MPQKKTKQSKKFIEAAKELGCEDSVQITLLCLWPQQPGYFVPAWPTL